MDSKELRRHPSSPRSIASYLATKDLDIEDKLLIARITAPGWKAKFENIDDLEEDELLVRQNILNGIKKFPPIKVNLRFNLRVKNFFSIRLMFARERF